MKMNSDVITSRHILQAVGLFDHYTHPPRHDRSHHALLFNGRRYPAAMILGLAYRVATSVSVELDEVGAGSAEAVEFFRHLGFDVEFQEC